METEKKPYPSTVKNKSEPKVSTLAIIRKLKQETKIRLWKTQKGYLKKIPFERTYTTD